MIKLTNKQIKEIKQFKYDNDYKFYQSIDFGSVSIDGNYNTMKTINSFLYADLLKDSTVLDVGCNLGVMCIYSYICGAKKIIGVDKNGYHLNKAKRLQDILKISSKKIKYICTDIEKYMVLIKNIDVVFLYSVLHHFKNMKSIIEFLIKKANKLVVIELLIKEEEDKKSVSKVDNYGKSFKWYPNKEAFFNYFNEIKCIKSVMTDKSEKSKNRMVFYLLK